MAFAASTCVLYLFYRRSLPARYDAGTLIEPSTAIRDLWLFRAGWVVLGVLLAAYLASERIGFPVSLPAAVVAAVLFLLAARSDVLSSSRVLREAPWKIVVFSLGMYVVVFGLRNAGLTAYLSSALRPASHSGTVPLGS